MVAASNAMPRISIVMPLYNKAAEVLVSVRSVQAQTVTNWELIVVDDGSTDDGAEQVRALADPRIRIIQQVNQGVSAARNTGIKSASTALVAFLDADDEWLPGYLEAVLALASDHPKAAWFATSYLIDRPSNAPYPARLRGLPDGFQRGILESYFQLAVKSDPPVCSSAVVVRRDAILAFGGFPVGIASGEDLLTWARLAVRFPLAYDSRPLAVFHVSGIDRQPDPAQKVGIALTELASVHSEIASFRPYLGLWFRMQAVMAMRFGKTALARDCAWRAVNYGPAQWRNSYTLLLACLPERWRHTLDTTLRRLAAR